MDVPTALHLLEQVIYKPGWTLTASDHTNRFQDTVLIRIDYPAHNSNRELARRGYPEVINTHATFPLVVGDCMTEDELWRRVLQAFIAIETHEAREFLRIPMQDFRAPFHPHRIEGMDLWPTDRMFDLQFGIG